MKRLSYVTRLQISFLPILQRHNYRSFDHATYIYVLKSRCKQRALDLQILGGVLTIWSLKMVTEQEHLHSKLQQAKLKTSFSDTKGSTNEAKKCSVKQMLLTEVTTKCLIMVAFLSQLCLSSYVEQPKP